MDIGSKVFGKTDKFGNALIVRGFYDENKEWTHASVHLKLAKLKKKRLLGHVSVQDATFHVYREYDKHYHRKMKGFGFNWELLTSNLIDIRTIALKVDDDKLYVFPVKLIKEHGKFLTFKEQGFELQRFIEYNTFRPYEKPLNNDKFPNYAEITH